MCRKCRDSNKMPVLVVSCSLLRIVLYLQTLRLSEKGTTYNSF